ncbi:hypothetical protein P3T39_002505 [Kitasatospora sp. GP82]|nr:hypothetical protein [Kitasatospora sp. GP82]
MERALIQPPTPGRRRQPRARAPLAVGLGLALLTGGLVTAFTAGPDAAAVTTTAPATAALGSNWYAGAPYLMPEDNNPQDPAAVMDATGQKAFQLAFILDGGSCTPAWGGTSPIGHTWHAKWWTQNENPSAGGQWGPWADDGPC